MTTVSTPTNMEPASSSDISPEAYEMIRRIMKDSRGFILDSYKDKCIKRRVAIRVRATHSASAEAYADLLLKDGDEVDRLLKVLTIHVSQFFRNPPTFDKLRTQIFPFLFTLPGINGNEELSIWSVGCASGEEPYTLALILKHFFPEELEKLRVTILATDVDAGILDVARVGIYGEERLMEVPEPLRQEYFVQRDGKFQLASEIRTLVEFRQADLADSETFPDCDLIVCRNVLIYFERQQQETILNGFADRLRPGGILVLGKSETLVGETRRRFQTVCPVERIYRVV